MGDLAVLAVEGERNRVERVSDIAADDLKHQHARVGGVSDRDRFLERDEIALVVLIGLQVGLDPVLTEDNVFEVNRLPEKQAKIQPPEKEIKHAGDRRKDHHQTAELKACGLVFLAENVPQSVEQHDNQVEDDDHPEKPFAS